MQLGSWLNCIATRDSLMWRIQNQCGPVIGIERLSLPELARLWLTVK